MVLIRINLALETQSRCYVLIEKSQYQGFCLLGARYAIFANSKWFAADEEEVFRQSLTRIDPHECAVDDMTKMLERLKSTDQFERSSDRKLFSDPQLLVDELALLKLDEIEDDDIRELDRCVRNLNYIGNGYLTKNLQMITEMLTALNSQTEIRLAEPTYIPSIRSPFSSDIFKLLSRFGPEAPSFWNDRGSEIVWKAGEKTIVMSNGKRKIGEINIYMNMPSKIMITPKPLLIAVRDLEKVVDKGKVKMDANERAGRYRHVSIEHDETKRKLWRELVVLCSNPDKKKKLNESKAVDGSNVDLDELMSGLLG
ncbi:hypothetical protein OnM2_067060 [Erysiphe neolycopersici]|uniref:Uncharacterized protein n=1 Tax=Erysiphe neolycopersici TaxID=212602 RepID=A0A420HM85_9PEZI|nr:hypothetical protein OnM2_067060 [Erysiphe neolycopersici]